MRHTSLFRAVLFAGVSLLPLAQANAKGVFVLQLGSYKTESEASAAIKTLQAKNSDSLSGMALKTSEVTLQPDNYKVYRTQAGPVSSKDEAQRLCSSIKTNGNECFVVESAMFASQPATPMIKESATAKAEPAPMLDEPKPVTFADEAPKTTAKAEPVRSARTTSSSTTRESFAELAPLPSELPTATARAPEPEKESAPIVVAAAEPVALPVPPRENLEFPAADTPLPAAAPANSVAAPSPVPPREDDEPGMFSWLFSNDEKDMQAVPADQQTAPAATQTASQELPSTPAVMADSMPPTPAYSVSSESAGRVSDPMQQRNRRYAPSAAAVATGANNSAIVMATNDSDLTPLAASSMEPAAPARSAERSMDASTAPEPAKVVSSPVSPVMENVQAIPESARAAPKAPVRIEEPSPSARDANLPKTREGFVAGREPKALNVSPAPAVAYVSEPEAFTESAREGNVDVAEAVRVPVSGERRPVTRVTTAQTETVRYAYPSQETHVRSQWAQLSSFSDEQAALMFWNRFSGENSDLSSNVRVRVTRPYMTALSNVSLRVGPYGSSEEIKELCNRVVPEGLRCTLSNDLGTGGAANMQRMRGYSSRDYASAPRGGMAMQESYWIQLGSYPSRAAAEDMWSQVQGKNRGLLKGKSSSIVTPPMSSSNRPLYRLRTGPFASSMDAGTLCGKLSAKGVNCIVVTDK